MVGCRGRPARSRADRAGGKGEKSDTHTQTSERENGELVTLFYIQAARRFLLGALLVPLCKVTCIFLFFEIKSYMHLDRRLKLNFVEGKGAAAAFAGSGARRLPRGRAGSHLSDGYIRKKGNHIFTVVFTTVAAKLAPRAKNLSLGGQAIT